MEATCAGELTSFGEIQFSGCELGDKRLTARAVATANRFIQHPGGTLPDKLNVNAELIGFYRLANNGKVTHAKLMAPHFQRTKDLMDRINGVVLVIHDTTELDFSGLDSVEDLGPIGHGGNGACRGFLCHNSLVYDCTGKEVLGLIHQTLRVRRKVPKNESPTAKRNHPQRESRLWKNGWSALAPAPQGQLRVNVCDRGADLFEFIEAVNRGGDHYVIRSKSNRNIEIEEGHGGVTKAKLHDYARGLATLGTRRVRVQSNDGVRGRQATVRIAAREVSLKAPHFARGEHSKQTLKAFVVHVKEIRPPAKCQPLEWILLTNIATDDFASACQRVDWYMCRPIIEEYHKAQKTGCGIELPQFTTSHALENVIGMHSVVAIQLLQLRDLSRRDDASTRPATDVVDREYVEAMSIWRFRERRPQLSVHEFCRALSKLGGHLNRTQDKRPGWLILWRGWTKLQLLVDGARGARIAKCV